MAFTRIAPVMRIFDEAKAREFYVDFLGFSLDFEHRHVAGAPLYMQVSMGGCVLQLSEHHGDGGAGIAITIETDELDAYHEVLIGKAYKYARPGIETMPWGSRNMTVADPFGNRITFTDAIST